MVGNAVGKNCSLCASQVCAQDPFCCDKTLGEWDDICVSEVDLYCTTLTC